MRPLSLVVSASLALAAFDAGAQSGNQSSNQPSNYPLTEPESISTVQVTAPAPAYHAYDYQIEAISGAYKMANGWRLKVDPMTDGIVAQVDKQRPIRLIAYAPDKYVSPDGNVSMQFNLGTYGDNMVMSYVPGPIPSASPSTGRSPSLAQR
jgi:hypothetical protein